MLTARQSIDLPPVWLALFAGLVWLSGAVFEPEPVGLLRATGFLAIAAGGVLMLLAIVEFRRHRTTVIPHQTATSLVTSGVYRASRNPIYLADALILAGLCLIWSPVGLILVPAFMALITHRFIKPEEARLRAAFGDAFDDWSARTRRWL